MKKPRLVTSIAIVGGSMHDWKIFQNYCDQTMQDKSGIAVGLVTRTIPTDFGEFSMKFLILFVDKGLNYSLKPSFCFSIQDIEKEGLENILDRTGKKIAINLQLKTRRLVGET